MKQLAATIDFTPNGNLKGFGPLGNPVGTGITNFSTFISMTIGLMTIIAFIWFVFTIFTGAISIISSGGDKNALESAKKKITTGIVGVVVVIVAIFIMSLIGTIFSIPFLDIFQLFYRLVPGGGTGGYTGP